jgi:hypothetical protein
VHRIAAVGVVVALAATVIPATSASAAQVWLNGPFSTQPTCQQALDASDGSYDFAGPCYQQNGNWYFKGYIVG